jgi:hypothetical protein
VAARAHTCARWAPRRAPDKCDSGPRPPARPPPAARLLQELSLARCPSLRRAPALAGLCAAPLPALRRLDLSRTRLRPSALRAVGAAPWCGALDELDVRNYFECFYSDRDMDAVFRALDKPPLAALAADGRLREDFVEEPPSDSCQCAAAYGYECDCEECVWDSYGCDCC